MSIEQSNAHDVLWMLRDLGLSVELEGGRLLVSSRSAITPEVRDLILAHRDELVATLGDFTQPRASSATLH